MNDWRKKEIERDEDKIIQDIKRTFKEIINPFKKKKQNN